MGDVTEDTRSIQEPVHANDGNNREKWMDEFIRSIFESVSPPLNVRIHKVTAYLKQNHDYEYYFVPKVVTLGPFHHNAKPEFEAVEKLKNDFTNRLLSGNNEILKSLYEKLSVMVKELRGYYDVDVTRRFSDEEFTMLMLQDGCFLLYVIKEYKTCDGLDLSIDLVELVKQDIFLMENQIPYQVLIEVMKFVPDDKWDVKINRFVDSNILVTERLKISNSLSDDENSDPIPSTTNYLLEVLQTRLTTEKCWCAEVTKLLETRRASEFADIGVVCRPNSSGSLACYNFVKMWFFLKFLEIPPITVRETTKGMFLNLVAHEMYTGDLKSPVTMYLCILDYLIAEHKDVRILRKAGVIRNLLGSDRRVFDMVKEIGESVRSRHFTLMWNCVSRKQLDNKAVTRDATYIKSVRVFVAVFGVFLLGLLRYLGVWNH